ncbi:MAG: nucleotidyltransferase [Bacillota bacterium]|nr:nucleotidyltransferase [Bacillota bacterium]
MRVLGLVVEYNPFHSGHLYHLEESRRVCQPDLTIAMMSGNFTQRGDAAIVDKWARAEMAVRCGVDVVFELPVAWAVRSARDFALGGVWHLDRAGATHLCFGSESGSAQELSQAADVLQDETAEFQLALRMELSTGVNYPRARYQALRKLGDETSAMLHEPNNILGVAYLLALRKIKSSIIPITIMRQGARYHDNNIESPLASATAIRKAMLSNTPVDSLPVPIATKEIISRELALGKGPHGIENLNLLIKYAIRNQGAESLAKLLDMEVGLAYRFKRCEESAATVQELISCVKTKRYTWTRLQRILCYALLGITTEVSDAIHAEGPQYLRILALKKAAAPLLKRLATSIPIVTRPSELKANTSLSLDVHATNIYALGFPDIIRGRAQQDLTRPPVIIE